MHGADWGCYIGCAPGRGLEALPGAADYSLHREAGCVRRWLLWSLRPQAPLHTGCGAVGDAATAGEAEQAEAGRMRTWVCMGRVEVATVHGDRYTRNHAFAIPRTPHWACASAQVRLLATVRGEGRLFPPSKTSPCRARGSRSSAPIACTSCTCSGPARGRTSPLALAPSSRSAPRPAPGQG